jgi:hypothetical protein
MPRSSDRFAIMTWQSSLILIGGLLLLVIFWVSLPPKLKSSFSYLSTTLAKFFSMSIAQTHLFFSAPAPFKTRFPANHNNLLCYKKRRSRSWHMLSNVFDIPRLYIVFITNKTVLFWYRMLLKYQNELLNRKSDFTVPMNNA